MQPLQLNDTQKHNACLLLCAALMEAGCTTYPALKGLTLRFLEKVHQNPSCKLSVLDLLRDPGVATVLLDAMLAGTSLAAQCYPLLKMFLSLDVDSGCCSVSDNVPVYVPECSCNCSTRCCSRC